MVELIRMECNRCIKSHSNRTQRHICVSQHSTIITPEPQWKCYDLKVTIFPPTVPLGLFSLMCSLPPLTPTFLTKAARPALSPAPPCQVRLAWLWTPCLHILLNTLLVDAGFLHNARRWDHALEMWALAQGLEEDGKKNRKERGAGACFSSFWWTV